MIKIYDNGWLESVVDSVTHKLLISDTTLRSFISTQVRRMTPILRQNYGCGFYIIPKDIRGGLNILRKSIVADLQHKYSGVHTRNSLFSTTSAACYKGKVFPVGEVLRATNKDAAQYITCTPIKLNNTIHVRCDLVFYYVFTEYIIPY